MLAQPAGRAWGMDRGRVAPTGSMFPSPKGANRDPFTSPTGPARCPGASSFESAAPRGPPEFFDVPEDQESPGFTGEGLNLMSHQADARHRLLNLVPTPRWERPGAAPSRKGGWGAGYSLVPAIQVWAERVRVADASRPARVVGVVGATSAGKSWLIGKLQDEGSATPSRLEEQFDGVTLQSMTSDVNVYSDARNELYYMDFEGTYGTQPLQLSAVGHSSVMDRCADAKAWEYKRRQALKECFQPAIAYLTCNVVIFVTREKLVCSRALEECEHFAKAANGRVVSALPPALILVQNCCRPSEGLFNPAQCTQAFKQTHLSGASLEWRTFFRTIDCFCLPDENLVCKRSGFDGEEVCRQVVASLKRTLRARAEEDLEFRLQNQVRLSQLQWFSVVSALCRIVNDNETVKMASLYTRVGATSGGLGELKSMLLLIMSIKAKGGTTVGDLLRVAVGVLARFAVRRELSSEELEESVWYLRGLFPCGSTICGGVECYERPGQPVTCGQMRLFHSNLHRSSSLVRTLDADWLQGLSEWLRGGVTHAWVGDFVCHPSYTDFDDPKVLGAVLHEEVEGYRLERCLEGLATEVGSPWVLKAHASLQRSGLKIRKDVSQICSICMAKGVSPGFFAKIWLPPEGSHLPVCAHCHALLEKHGICGPDMGMETLVWDEVCEACTHRDPWSGARRQGAQRRHADHRLFPCKCSVCLLCAEVLLDRDQPACPICAQPTRWMVDERALAKSSWPAAVRRATNSQGSCNTCASGRR